MKSFAVLLSIAMALGAPAEAAGLSGAADGQKKASREFLIGRWTPEQGACARAWIDLGADGNFKTPGDYQGGWTLKDGYLIALDIEVQQYILTGQATVVDQNTMELDGKSRLYRCT